MKDGARFDIVIVGGGPAGVAAANMLSSQGLRIAVIDEQQRPGGQILRQPPSAFRVRNWLAGRLYRPVKDAIATFEGDGDIEWHGGRSVIGLECAGPGFQLTTAGPSGVEDYLADRILLAAGCYDLPVMRPGWTLPGVMAAGGVQTLLKSQQLLPTDPLLLAGTHPLMVLIADQVTAAGGTVAAICFEQRLSAMIRPALAAPATVLRNIPLFLGVLASVVRLRRHGVSIRFGVPLMGIDGADRAEAARFRDAAGHENAVACGMIGLCYGFVPQSDLVRLIGAEVFWAASAGGWAACHDDGMRTSIAGVYVAGETAGVGGAATALTEGRLAAVSILRDLGRLEPRRADERALPLAKRRRRQRAFADMLAAIGDPKEALSRSMPPETILCRCEDVSQASIDASLTRTRCANTIKLETRIGMGLCQGRSCEHAVIRCIGTDGNPVVQGFTPRFPLRPVRIGDLAMRRPRTPFKGVARQKPLP